MIDALLSSGRVMREVELTSSDSMQSIELVVLAGLAKGRTTVDLLFERRPISVFRSVSFTISISFCKGRKRGVEQR